MTPTAVRVRRHRERVRNGLVCLTVEVDEVQLSERLIEVGLLHPAGSDSRDRLREALEQVVRLWAADGR